MCMSSALKIFCISFLLLVAEWVAQRLEIADANTPASHLTETASPRPFSPYSPSFTFRQDLQHQALLAKAFLVFGRGLTPL